MCIGVHVEPFGATVSTRVSDAAGATPESRPARRRVGALGPDGRPSLSYEHDNLFRRHVADIQTFAQIVERHGGKLTLQAQTPFTRRIAENNDSLFRDLEQCGHEIGLHFHENEHLGFNSARLPADPNVSSPAHDKPRSSATCRARERLGEGVVCLLSRACRTLAMHDPRRAGEVG